MSHEQQRHLRSATFASRFDDDDGAALAMILVAEWGPEKAAATIAALRDSEAELTSAARACGIAAAAVRWALAHLGT